jgi:hypothetical protein
MADPLVEVAVRVYAEFADRATLAEVLAVVARCRNDLDAPSAAALPEMVERLARQRLADRVASPATSNGATPYEHGGGPTGEPGSSAPGAPRVREPIADGAGLDDLPGEGEPIDDGCAKTWIGERLGPAREWLV